MFPACSGRLTPAGMHAGVYPAFIRPPAHDTPRASAPSHVTSPGVIGWGSNKPTALSSAEHPGVKCRGQTSNRLATVRHRTAGVIKHHARPLAPRRPRRRNPPLWSIAVRVNESLVSTRLLLTDAGPFKSCCVRAGCTRLPQVPPTRIVLRDSERLPDATTMQRVLLIGERGERAGVDGRRTQR